MTPSQATYNLLHCFLVNESGVEHVKTQ